MPHSMRGTRCSADRRMCVTTIHGGLNIVAFFFCVFATDLALAEEPIPTDLTHLIQPVWNLS